MTPHRKHPSTRPRINASKRPLPRCFASRRPAAKGIVSDVDIFIHRHGRLAAKVVVFDELASLRSFWRRVLGHDPGRKTRGVCNPLSAQRQRIGGKGKPDGPKVYEGDPRYFCIIGLIVGHLTADIIAHEAVHAAYAYEKRVRRNLFGPAADFDEERIAYPAGIITGAINQHLHNRGLYEQ